MAHVGLVVHTSATRAATIVSYRCRRGLAPTCRDAEAREGVVLQVAVLAEEVLHPLGLRAGVRCRHVRRFGRLLATRDLQMPDYRSEIHSSRAETSITALYRVRKLGSSFPGR